MLSEGDIKIVSYNVLYPQKAFVNLLLTSPFIRYEYQIQTLLPQLAGSNTDFAIFCLQEVTQDYIDAIDRIPGSLEGFLMTPPDSSLIYSDFPVILTKLNYDLLYNKNKLLICLFKDNDVNFIGKRPFY